MPWWYGGRGYSSQADILLTDTIIYHCQLIFITQNGMKKPFTCQVLNIRLNTPLKHLLMGANSGCDDWDTLLKWRRYLHLQPQIFEIYDRITSVLQLKDFKWKIFPKIFIFRKPVSWKEELMSWYIRGHFVINSYGQSLLATMTVKIWEIFFTFCPQPEFIWTRANQRFDILPDEDLTRDIIDSNIVICITGTSHPW